MKRDVLLKFEGKRIRLDRKEKPDSRPFKNYCRLIQVFDDSVLIETDNQSVIPFEQINFIEELTQVKIPQGC